MGYARQSKRVITITRKKVGKSNGKKRVRKSKKSK
jgi:hypothetical protein